MTIGDEKVVAWLLDSGGNRTYWADGETARKEYGNLCVLGYRSDTTLTSLIPQSAYAELAADRDLWRSMATFEGKVSASVLDDLHTTQAQLAELRGRVLEIDALMRKDIAEFGGCLKLVNRLRTLAAADGGGG